MKTWTESKRRPPTQENPPSKEERSDDLEDWDVVCLPCTNCGNQDWSSAQVDLEVQQIIRCNRCPLVKVLH